jgi:hypothetical protein
MGVTGSSIIARLDYFNKDKFLQKSRRLPSGQSLGCVHAGLACVLLTSKLMLKTSVEIIFIR